MTRVSSDVARTASAAQIGKPDAGAGSNDAIEISIVIPLMNEEGNVDLLYQRLTAALRELGKTYEIIAVDDGSTDTTYTRLADLASMDLQLKVIRLRRNFGQTAAMSAGFDLAQGPVIVPIDGDLQNDPGDIGMLVDKLDEGYDVVSGWRRKRQDTAMHRIPSTAANWLIGAVTGVRLHDYGCTLKAYRAEVIKDTHLYGEMHRFLPALAHLQGARITEVVVRHHPRIHGSSKYGLKRTLKVVLDLITVKFLSSVSTKPIYAFGGVGFVLCSAGTAAAAVTLWEKLADHIYVHRNPMILVAVFLFSLGVNLILMGLLAELIIRTYHESQAKPTYTVRTTLNTES